MLFCVLMMRPVFTFLLSLFLLLIQGHSYASHSRISQSTAEISVGSGQATFAATEITSTSISGLPVSDQEDDAISVAELNDDDDLESERKYIEITNHLITFFYAPVSGYCYPYHKDRLPFCKHFSYNSSDKYIVQRVIRI